ncbi:Protein adenylyltransferase SelO [Labeo rohita]|uniref:Protein adenylyltransferase SelO n=1 Tax=Labeo rohita TaxID=84645 RepID=A0ABQ8LGC2_LABRO|nr:Protein adenylyltransferase SelO [Labeo rohita]
MQNDTTAQKLPTPPNDQVLCLSPADVRRTLSRINPRHVLRDCAAKQTDILTDIFNMIPHVSQIHNNHNPKKSPVSCLNDYCPIALTPIMMKCFERLVMHNIKSSLPNTLQFNTVQTALRTMQFPPPSTWLLPT